MVWMHLYILFWIKDSLFKMTIYYTSFKRILKLITALTLPLRLQCTSFLLHLKWCKLCWMRFFFLFWFKWLYFILIFSVLFFASGGMRFADYTSNFDDLKVRVVAENNFSRLISGMYTFVQGHKAWYITSCLIYFLINCAWFIDIQHS